MPVRRGELSGTCSICRHSQRYRIELALVSGASRTAVAKRFSVSGDAAGRHLRNHVSPERRAQLVAGPLKLHELAERAAEADQGLQDHLAIIRTSLMAQFLAAAEVNDRHGIALIGARVLECLRLEAQVNGELSKSTATITNNTLVLASPLMAELQAMLAARLRPFPDACRAVLEGLRELTAKSALQGTAEATGPLMLGAAPSRVLPEVPRA
jgi:hypothetical protein